MERQFELRKEALLAECQVSPSVFRGFEDRLEQFVEPFASCLVRTEQREHAMTIVSGLVSDLDRKNTESIAYRHDQDRKDLQHFVGESNWDHEPIVMELANEWALGANTGFFTDREGSDDFVVWLQSVALGIPINECWGMYVEYFGLYETQKAGAVDRHSMDSGVTYLWNNDLQFDFRVGFGLNDDADDVFAGTGVSMRF